MPILDQFGRPIKPASLKKAISVPSPIRTLTGTPPAQLEPAKLAALMRAASEGDAERYLVLAEEMEERYLHYSAQLDTRKRAVSGIVPLIVPASEDKRDVEIAEFLTGIVPVIKSAAFDLMDALGKGYAVCEIVWDFGDKWAPRQLKRVDPRWFFYDKDTGQELRWKTESAEGDELAPGKYIVHRAQFKSGLPIRGGLARAAAWGWMASNFGIQEWMTFIEQFGKPLRIGKYMAGAATPADLDVLWRALQSLGMDAAAMFPDNMQIEFPEVAAARGENGLWLNLIEYFDRQISKLVLGQTLTADTGKNGGGSFSLGQVHNEVRLDILADDAERLAETINTQLIPILVSLNFGDVETLPTFTIPVEEPEDQVALIGIVEKAVKMGQPVGREWFSRKFNIPLPEEGEEVLTPPATGAAEPAEMPDPQDKSARTARHRAGDETDKNNGIDRLVKDTAPAMRAWLTKLAAMLEAAESMEEFRSMLVNAYPDLGQDEMVATLSPAFMSAFLQGMDAVGTKEKRK
ncbi:MAG: DUF935 domain-containing protein [Zoogloeaceae bacterium]|jgi:phage gp29-like protein|nr:DUF935 domain-containing protein [Zoogloeaceae bacterium]